MKIEITKTSALSTPGSGTSGPPQVEISKPGGSPVPTISLGVQGQSGYSGFSGYSGIDGFLGGSGFSGNIVTGKHDSLSSGERTGKSLNRWFRPSGLWDSNVDQGH